MPRCKICLDKCLENPLGLCVRCKIQLKDCLTTNIHEEIEEQEERARSNTPELSRDNNIIGDDDRYNSLITQNMQLMFELEQYKITIENMRKDYELAISNLDMEMKQQIKALKDEYDRQISEAQEKRLTKRTIKRNETKIRKLEAQIKKKRCSDKFSRLSAGKSARKSKSNE